jgi:diguanylate cyclase (GGDEF)-like protein
VVGSLVVLHDVTEREAAAAALREAHTVLEQRIQERTSNLSQKIQELRSLENQLSFSATHDSLTGLPNRKLFLDRVTQRIETSGKGTIGEFAVFYVDLDRFKIYNDGFGHHLGDLILTEMGRRLQSCLRASDLAARMGGDEFTILLDEVQSLDEVSQLARFCQAALAKPAHLAGAEIHLTASIGIAISGGGGNAKELVRDADLAMYRAKKAGGNQTIFFGESMRSSALSLVQLEQDLRQAVFSSDQIIVQYQPFVHMLSRKVVGFEALVRWRHPERGLLLPAEFLPVAEQTGLLMAIDEFVLREACRQKESWEVEVRDASVRPFVSVNVSGWQLSHPHRWRKVLTTLKSQLGGLRLEMLESVLVANAHLAVEFFEQVRTHQLQIYLDDFGTGYSSLSWLSQFPIHSLKIDRSFVKDIASDGKDISIVRAIIALARSLEIEVVAEGIESEPQSKILQQLGCVYGQGFYFSPAVDGQAALAMLKREPQFK